MRRQMLACLALVAFTGTLQAVQTWRAVVPAQDAVRYARTAQQIERNGLRTTAAEEERVVFSACVLAVRKLDAWARSNNLALWPRLAWGDCAQLTAATAATLAILPIYIAFCLWLRATAPAVLGAVLFAAAPAVVDLGADGLGDSTHLLCAATSIALGVAALRATGNRQATILWTLAGAALGAAWLVRSEALFLVPAFAAGAIAVAWTRRERLSQAALALCAPSCSLAVGIALPLFAHGTIVSGVGPWQRTARLVAAEQVPQADALDDDVAGRWLLASGEEMTFPFKEHTTSSRFHGLLPATGELASELAAAAGAGLLVLAIGGFRPLRIRTSADALFATLAITVAAGSVIYASGAGYLSERHLVLLLVPLAGRAGRGIWCIAVQLATAQTSRLVRNRAVLPVATVAIVLVINAPRWREPPHASRIAHRRAAAWLDAAQRDGAVLDTRGWTLLYSGRPTYRYDESPRALCDPHLAYLVVERRDLEVDSPRARTLADVLHRAARAVATLPGPPAKPASNVLIYEWDASRFTHSLANQPNAYQLGN